MSKIMRIGGKLASRLEQLQREYSDGLRKPIQMTQLTDRMSDRIEEDGLYDFWLRDARKKRRRRR